MLLSKSGKWEEIEDIIGLDDGMHVTRGIFYLTLTSWRSPNVYNCWKRCFILFTISCKIWI